MQTKNVGSKSEKQLFKSIKKVNPKEIIKEALSSVQKKEKIQKKFILMLKYQNN